MANASSASPNEIIVEGGNYEYTFSRGLLAHSLELRGLPLDEAYKVAKQVQVKLNRENISRIAEDELRRVVRDMSLKLAGKEVASQYNIIEKWHISSEPLIILIAGARGTETSLLAKSIADKLAIPRIVNTSVLTQVLRKMIAPDLTPELHQRSYKAWQKLRPVYSVLYDKVLVGFEEHSRYPAESVEALVRRSLIEGLSMVIHGEHLVPRFISDELVGSANVVYVIIEINDEEKHKEFYLDGTNKSSKKKNDNFISIRKIHDYLVEEGKKRNNIIVELESLDEAEDELYNIVLNRLSKIIVSKSFDEYSDLDTNILHS